MPIFVKFVASHAVDVPWWFVATSFVCVVFVRLRCRLKNERADPSTAWRHNKETSTQLEYVRLYVLEPRCLHTGGRRRQGCLLVKWILKMLGGGWPESHSVDILDVGRPEYHRFEENHLAWRHLMKVGQSVTDSMDGFLGEGRAESQRCMQVSQSLT